MKFKELDKKQIFTWWERDQHHTGCKLGERQAFCFDLLEVLDVHTNKDVKQLDNFDATLEYKVGRDGKGFLCSPMDGGKVLARRIILIGSEIMHENDLKTGTQPKAGESQDIDSQVYIILSLLMRKLKDLETVAKTVQLILDEKSECVTSDNNIMSTYVFERGRALTE